MIEFIKAGIGLFLQLAVFFSMGSLLMKALKMKENASFALIMGYFLYFSVFEIIVVPMIILWVPLRSFSIGWGIFLAAVAVSAVMLLWKQWKGQLTGMPAVFQKHSWMLLLAAAVILLQCIIVVLNQDVAMDAAYYVGTVSTSVYTGTMERYNPYTGALLRYFNKRYVFSGYPMHNAVWCELLGLHPVVQTKVIMPVINVLTANLIVYQLGKILFDDHRKKADLMVCFVCVLQLFSDTTFSTGRFFFTRSYEGKALLANIAIPAVLYCCIRFWKREEEKLWILLFLASLSAVTFSGSSIIAAAGIAAGILPVLCWRRQFSKLIPLGICILPEAVYLLLYYAVKLGWIVLRAS